MNKIPGESFTHQEVVAACAKTRLFVAIVNSKDKSLHIGLVLLMRPQMGVGIGKMKQNYFRNH